MGREQQRRRSSIIDTIKDQDKEAKSLFVNYAILLVLLLLLWAVYVGLW